MARYIRIKKHMLRTEDNEVVFNSDTKEGNKDIICPIGKPSEPIVTHWRYHMYPVYVDDTIYYIRTYEDQIRRFEQLLFYGEKIRIKGKGTDEYKIVGGGSKMYRAKNSNGVEVRRNYINKKGELTFEPITPAERKKEEINIVESDGFNMFVDAIHTNSRYNREDYLPAIYKNYEAATKAKTRLRDILRKHPNWNEEQQCVEISVAISRNIDPERIFNDMAALDDEVSKQPIFSRNSLTLWNEVVRTLKYTDPYEIRDNVYKIRPQYADRIQKINFSVDLTDINYAQKASRVIHSIMTKFKVNFNSDVERAFANVSDSLSIKSKKYKLVLSINPADFVTMSHGNSWQSCHSFRANNCYHAGCLSYALDNSTMIAYIIPEDSTGDNYKVDKIMRLLYMFSEEGKGFMSTKMYPNNNDKAARASFDNAVYDILKACEVELPETLHNPESYGRINTFGRHYPDYNYGYANHFGENYQNYSIGSDAYSFEDPSLIINTSNSCTTISRATTSVDEVILLTEEIESALKAISEPESVVVPA